ncbi:hypothetical protein LCGC14_2001570 [marine sediment metagenome]|uniref:Uncharacterized protein n=1 Tax=marine sediment metagenome TaxID=412755 RepID=A0A0F9F307_9ZZZZ
MNELNGWTVILKNESTEGFCWQREKVIDLGLLNSNPFKTIFIKSNCFLTKFNGENFIFVCF